MDGENNGKPYEQMDDLGGKPTIFGNPHLYLQMSLLEPFPSSHLPCRRSPLLGPDTT